MSVVILIAVICLAAPVYMAALLLGIFTAAACITEIVRALQPS